MVAKVIPEERKCPICPNTFLVGGYGRPRSKKYCSPRCSGIAGRKKQAVLSSELTDLQAAYLAGMIDADGHIGIYKHSKDGASSRLILTISNTDVPMLEWVQKITGIGSVTQQAKGDERNKPTFYWNTGAEAAASLLAQTLPYMLVKRARAELAIEFQEGLGNLANRANPSWREGYREKMLKLNKRGPVAA